MADENYPRDVDDQVDPDDLAAVEQALAGLDFLRPDGPGGPPSRCRTGPGTD